MAKTHRGQERHFRDLKPGECCSEGGSQPSREKPQCHFWVMGINNHQGKSCATHSSLLILTLISTLLWKLKANFSLCFGRKKEKKKKRKPQAAEPPRNLPVTVTRKGGVPEQEAPFTRSLFCPPRSSAQLQCAPEWAGGQNAATAQVQPHSEEASLRCYCFQFHILTLGAHVVPRPGVIQRAPSRPGTTASDRLGDGQHIRRGTLKPYRGSPVPGTSRAGDCLRSRNPRTAFRGRTAPPTCGTVLARPPSCHNQHP